MKKVILSLLVFVTAVCFPQGPKPDLANLPSTDEVSLSIKGLTLENKITQQQLVATKQLDLKGENAAKYKIAYYHFRTNYQHTFSQNDEFYNNEITPAMTQFFTDLEKNCKLIYENMVIQNIETGKQFKIAPLTVIVKVE